MNTNSLLNDSIVDSVDLQSNNSLMTLLKEIVTQYNIDGLNFFDEDETESKEDVETSSDTIQPTTSEKQLTNIESAISDKESTDPVTFIGKVDQNLLKKLLIVLEEQQSSGIDYLKFKKSLDSLKELLSDDTIRFTSAFITLKAANPSFNKKGLLETIDKYIHLMENERRAGLQQLQELRVKNVDSKVKNIDEATKVAEKLIEEVHKLVSFISESSKEIHQRKTKYAIQEANFNATVDSIVDQLQEDKTKIETIIK